MIRSRTTSSCSINYPRATNDKQAVKGCIPVPAGVDAFTSLSCDDLKIAKGQIGIKGCISIKSMYTAWMVKIVDKTKF